MLSSNYTESIQVTNRLAVQALHYHLWSCVWDMHFVRDMLESEQILVECETATKKLKESIK